MSHYSVSLLKDCLCDDVLQIIKDDVYQSDLIERREAWKPIQQEFMIGLQDFIEEKIPNLMDTLHDPFTDHSHTDDQIYWTNLFLEIDYDLSFA